MNMTKTRLSDYRNGAIGSLVDEYEKALEEFKSVLRGISESQYKKIVDTETENEDCRSIATMTTHVVRAGYLYAKYIRGAMKLEDIKIPDTDVDYLDIDVALDSMFEETLRVFDGRWDDMDRDLGDKYIDSSWGMRYNIDQMLEHAIVHLLRHRRQTEKFILIQG